MAKKITFILLNIFLTKLAAQIIQESNTPFIESAKTYSLEQKIGQMIMIGIGSSTEVDENHVTVKAIQQGYAGGVLLFERNIKPVDSKKNLQKLTSDLQQYATIPLIISIDQEGGKVNRMKEKYGFPKSVTAKYLGKQNDLNLSKQYADSTASILNQVGINLNFAPCVDIDKITNPIIGKYERAYSADTDIITKQATQFVESHRAYGVMTALKHFPGHGSATSDTHKGIADVSNSWTETELEPYIQLLAQQKVDAILVAHVVNYKLDSTGNPATLSYPIVTELLRKKLAYQGVLFTDDMQMHAITLHYGLKEAIKKAILAGMDILVFSNHIATKGQKNVGAAELVKMIATMVQAGEIPESRITESFNRILNYKQNLMKKRTIN